MDVNAGSQILTANSQNGHNDVMDQKDVMMILIITVEEPNLLVVDTLFKIV